MVHHKHAEMEAQVRTAMLVAPERTSERPLPESATPEQAGIVKQGVRCEGMNSGWKEGATEILKLGWAALRVLRSGIVPDAVSDARCAACYVCPHSMGIENAEGVVYHFCLCCRCGIWSDANEEGSAIEFKNRHPLHRCSRLEPAFVEYDGPTIKTKDPLWVIVRRMAKAWAARNHRPDSTQ